MSTELRDLITDELSECCGVEIYVNGLCSGCLEHA